MTAPPAHAALTRVAADLAADARSLDGLKRGAQRDPRGALRQAAQQFEALFMQMVLKSMRAATLKSGLLDSPAQDLYAGMLDQQIAGQVAASGTGLAGMIARQLMRQMGQPEDGGPAAAHPLSATAPGVQSRPTHASADRYAELARPDPGGAARYAELATRASSSSAREAYLNRRDLAVEAAEPAPRTAGARRLATDGTALPLDSPQGQFLARHAQHARAAQRATGIPARFILAQAALESGWGTAEVRGRDGEPSYNLFGIKATGGWRGRTVDAVTTEVIDGVVRRSVERFRAYADYGEAFRDWALLIRDNPRYAQVLAHGHDARGFAYGLQDAGYATDPEYGAKLVRVIATLSAGGRAAGSGGTARNAAAGAAGWRL